MTTESVLAFARSQDYLPSTNLRDASTGALWMLMLPSLADLESIAWIGDEDDAELRALRDILPAARIAAGGPRDASPSIRVDAAYLAMPRSSGAATQAIEALTGMLRPGGTAVMEGRGWRMRTLAARWARNVGGPDTPVALLRAHPLAGSVRAIVDATDPEALRTVARRGLLRPSFNGSVVKAAIRRRATSAHPTRPARSVTQPAPAAPPMSRVMRSLLAAPLGALEVGERLAASWDPTSRFIVAAGPDAGRLPRYLRRVGGLEDAGDVRWSLVGPGAFASQKVLWFVAPRREREFVVKMTRSPRFSYRLHNAARALESLGAPDGVAPRLLFAGEEAGLAIAAESIVEGVPIGRRPSAATPAVARRAIGALLVIAERTRTWSTGPAVAAALDDLLDRAATRGVLEPPHIEILRSELGAVAALDDRVPTVMQHGDPGVLNVLLRDDGAITILDWENADDRGMPLWDILYFIRSMAIARREADRRAGALGPFEGHGPLTAVLLDAIRGASQVLGIPAAMVRPLVLHCWVQQALKESTRLDSADASRSVFGRFLGALIERRHDPAVARLWNGGTTA
jgi:hypothetical protein